MSKFQNLSEPKYALIQWGGQVRGQRPRTKLALVTSFYRPLGRPVSLFRAQVLMAGDIPVKNAKTYHMCALVRVFGTTKPTAAQIRQARESLEVVA